MKVLELISHYFLIQISTIFYLFYTFSSHLCICSFTNICSFWCHPGKQSFRFLLYLCAYLVEKLLSLPNNSFCTRHHDFTRTDALLCFFTLLRFCRILVTCAIKHLFDLFIYYFFFFAEHRHVGSNNFNLFSSRSHTIFTLVIISDFQAIIFQTCLVLPILTLL